MLQLNKLYNMDCMEGMKQFPDKYFELAIVDPPYGINFAKTHTGKGWIVRESKNWDKSIPDKEYFKELFRVSKEQIIWGEIILLNIYHHQWDGYFGIKGKEILV